MNMDSLTWLRYILAVVMLGVTLYCLTRIVVAKRLHRSNDYNIGFFHVFMGVAMAGMFISAWSILTTPVWVAIFSIFGAWFIFLSARVLVGRQVDTAHRFHTGHYVVHVVMALGMLYMYWLMASPASASSGSSGMMGSSSSMMNGDPGLTFVFVVILFGSAIWELNKIDSYAPSSAVLVSAGGGSSGSSSRVALANVGSVAPTAPAELAPRLEIVCHVTMCIAMGFMMILML